MISGSVSRPRSVTVSDRAGATDARAPAPAAHDAVLAALLARGLISELDRHFGAFVLALAADAGADDAARAALLPAALLASRETADGNVCVKLPLFANKPLFDAAATPAAPPWPRWAALLRRSAVVGRPGAFQPLVLDRHGRLYLYRYWDYERRLAADLKRRAVAGGERGNERDDEERDDERLAAALARLFPDRDPREPDWQQLAAATALTRRLCVISGGPGTGKTTTVVRILALLLERRPTLRIALAAPTGKAAARLQQSVRDALARLPPDDALRERIPQQASTVHRLLGPRPHSAYFRHDRDRPLALDVLVVDEASMLDLALLTKLTDALPDAARLLLLGDKDQLASVDAGAVLGDVCGPLTADAPPLLSAAQRRRLRRLTGAPLPDAEPAPSAAPPLADCVVLLRRVYRFAGDGAIGALAAAVNRGDAATALGHLYGADRSLRWRELGKETGDGAATPAAEMLRRYIDHVVCDAYGDYLREVRAGAPAAQAFAAFGRFQLLCARRLGPYGTDACNRLIEELLRRRGLLGARRVWYPGRPVIVTENDHALGLYNGDVGIALPDPDDGGRLKVWFDGGAARRFGPGRLPPHETVFALTVHKSQGSEFDRVAIVLPPESSRVLSRELLYTGITRARSGVEVWGNADVFTEAVGKRLRRASALREMLWGRAQPGGGRTPD